MKNGVIPQNPLNTYVNSYVTISNLADQGDEMSRKLYEYHNKTIEKYIFECAEKLNSENIDIFEEFIYYTEKINILIYWMGRIFTYLDRFFVPAKYKTTLSETAMNLYRSIFFENCKKKFSV